MLCCNVIKSRMHVLRGGRAASYLLQHTGIREQPLASTHQLNQHPLPPHRAYGWVEGLDLLKTSDIPVIILKMFSNYVIHLFQTNYFPSPKLILQLLRCQRAEDASQPPHQPRAVVVIIIAISWWDERRCSCKQSLGIKLYNEHANLRSLIFTQTSDLQPGNFP